LLSPWGEAQAKSFLGHNLVRVGVTKLQMFHAACAAGDPDALTAKQVCERAGVKILLTQPVGFKSRETMAINAIVALAKKHGAMVARQILEAIADAGVEPILARHIRAAELLMRDGAYAKDRMSYTDLTATIARHKRVEEFEAKTLAAATRDPLYAALALFWHRMRVKAKVPAVA
jgi:hypothetical protein